MSFAKYSVFICYRTLYRSFAEQVYASIEAAGCQPELDIEYAQRTISHRSQSVARILDADCVGVVLPPDFSNWLPKTMTDLHARLGQDDNPELANEISAVMNRMTRDPNKPVILMLMQESPTPTAVRDLPSYLRDLPGVIECGNPDWPEQLTARLSMLQSKRDGRRTPQSASKPEQLQIELASLLVEWMYGRSGGSTLGAPDSDPKYANDTAEFAYHPTFYVHLPGKFVSPLQNPGEEPPHVDSPTDVVGWIVRGTSRQAWLVGDAGSGKTIALTKAASQAAEEWIYWSKGGGSSAGPTGAPGSIDAPRLPILLTCPSFYPAPGLQPTGKWEGITHQLLTDRMAGSVGRTWEEFRDLLQHWRCLLLFDALDEVADPNAATRIEKAIVFLQQFALDMRVVITTRTRDLRPSPATVDVLEIQPLNFTRGAELIDRIAVARLSLRGRLQQVRRLLGQPGIGAEDLTNPLGITLACMLASQPDPRGIQARFGEFLDRLLAAVCDAVDDEGIGREELRRLALDAMQKGHNRMPLARVAELLDGHAGPTTVDVSLFRARLHRLAGIVRIVRTADNDYLDFGHASFLNYLAAEATADWPVDGLFARLRSEITAWKRVAEFLPALLARRGRVDDANAFLSQLADAAAPPGKDSALIWLTGLHALADSETLQRSPDARVFAGKAKAAVASSAGTWTDNTRAGVLDAYGLAVRPYLAKGPRGDVPEILPAWIAVKELETPTRRISVAFAPVIVAEYAEFLNDDPDNRDSAFWKHGANPSFVHESDDGAWYDQLRTPLRPVTGVSWYEARAFCEWLTRRDPAAGTVRLPKPGEWKGIARPGGDDRPFPWVAETDRFNHRDTGLRRPSPVGLFPPYCRPGLFDFGSNVFEWSQDGPGDDEAQVLGGCWSSYREHLLIDRKPIFFKRSEQRPDTGFRCVLEQGS